MPYYFSMSNEPPYQVLDGYKRFSAANTIFERMRLDPDYIHRLNDEPVTHSWDQAEMALKHAAWSVLRPLAAVAYSKERHENLATEQYIPANWSDFTREIKNFASFFGATIVGITHLNRKWLYTQPEGEIVPEDMNTVIVMAVEMDRPMIKTSPSPLADAATANGYAKMAFITTGMIGHVRHLGWRAIGCGNDTALSIPLAIDSGLGEFGRNGLLATPELGSRFRICKIFTDMPLESDKPETFGMADRCDKCRRCVNACPAGAISNGEKTSVALNPSTNPGVLKWPVDGEKCRLFWHRNGVSCSSCISACPLS